MLPAFCVVAQALTLRANTIALEGRDFGMARRSSTCMASASLTPSFGIIESGWRAVCKPCGAPMRTPFAPPTLTFALVLAASAATAACYAQAGPGYTRSRSEGVNVRHVPSTAPAASRAEAAGKIAVPRRGLVLRNRRRARRPQDGIVSDVDPASFPSEVATLDASGRLRYSHGDGHNATRGPRSTRVTARNGARKPTSRAAAKR